MSQFWTLLLILLVALLSVYPLEIEGGRLLMRTLSTLSRNIRQRDNSPIVFKENEEPESTSNTDFNSEISLNKEEELMWQNMVNDVMNDTDNLDDTIYGEEEDDDDGLATRTGIPESVDCYGLPAPISKALRFLFRTDRKETVNTHYFISTRNHRESVEMKNDPNFDLSRTDFDPERRTVFIIHGFMSNGRMEWVKNLTNALLDRADSNVIVVDWSGGGGSWKYWRAVANTRVTGAEVTKLINNLMETTGLKSWNIHLIGHSLGAHICSYVAAHIKGIARITGLDPAQPCFQADSPDIRLDPSDAEFIDVIHTNGRMLEKVGLGLPQPIGHVDFYPNGGKKQPGCSNRKRTIFFPVLNLIKNRIEKSICSHGRSYMFFIESLKRADSCSFWGHRWDMKDSDVNAAVLAPCNAANCTEMGIEADIFPARGIFYVSTEANTPYCVQDPRTDNEMVNSLSKLYRRVGRIDRNKRNSYSTE